MASAEAANSDATRMSDFESIVCMLNRRMKVEIPAFIEELQRQEVEPATFKILLPLICHPTSRKRCYYFLTVDSQSVIPYAEGSANG
jgi:hypothetical protein